MAYDPPLWFTVRIHRTRTKVIVPLDTCETARRDTYENAPKGILMHSGLPDVVYMRTPLGTF